MQPKAPILVPTTAQIDQLRADFFIRLDQKGSPVAGNNSHSQHCAQTTFDTASTNDPAPYHARSHAIATLRYSRFGSVSSENVHEVHVLQSIRVLPIYGRYSVHSVRLMCLRACARATYTLSLSYTPTASNSGTASTSIRIQGHPNVVIIVRSLFRLFRLGLELLLRRCSGYCHFYSFFMSFYD